MIRISEDGSHILIKVSATRYKLLRDDQHQRWVQSNGLCWQTCPHGQILQVLLDILTDQRVRFHLGMEA